MSQTFTIEPLIPMALLNVESTLDNQYWRFCADDVVDELTYENFDLGPDAILAEGTKVVMPYLWGWYDRTEGNTNLEALTPATDYEVVLPKAATVRHVVHVILSQYHEQMQVNDAAGRYFYIEAVRETQPGVVEIVWGT
jgi:hypothetical protein